MKHPPACGELWPVGSSDRVGGTHGVRHRCALDVGHGAWHVCACGRCALDIPPISAVMESVDE